MFQRPPSASRNCSSAPGRSGNSNRQTRSDATCRRPAADHVADVELGHLVAREIGGLVTAVAQPRRQLARPSPCDRVATPTKICARSRPLSR